jgi:hypothetical protein
MPSNRLRDSLDTLTKQTVFHVLNEVFLFQFLMEFFCLYMDVARMYPGMLISMHVPFPHIFRIEFEPLDVPAALHNRSFFRRIVILAFRIERIVPYFPGYQKGCLTLF